MQRFPIRFTGLNHAMAVVGMVPSRCSVDLTDEHLHVRMGMWFDLEAPRDTVQSAALNSERVYGWGVHGWRDKWLVNGSSEGLVQLTFAPTQRAWMGPVPLRVRVLRVSLDDPEGLVAALAATTS
ncbi:MAG: hypothetical protein U0W40_15730 [Acidimicrobiia bacterium]